MSLIDSYIWILSLQLVVLSGEAMELLGCVHFLEEVVTEVGSESL